MFGADEAILMC